jgi:DNA-binding FrmR family transcriptional regulator
MQDEKQKVALIQRLKRVEGQVRGVQRMIDEDRDCREIAQQLQAIRSAVQAANHDLIQTRLAECAASGEITGDKINEITKLFNYLD